MAIPQFKIIHYLYFTAIASLLFAVAFGPFPENVALGGTLLLLIVTSPIVLPLLPRSPESLLLCLPDDPEDRIAVLERVVARPLWLGRGAKRSVRIKLVQLYRERGRFTEAVNLGRSTLARFRMSAVLEHLVRLELALCLDRLGRDSEARAQLERVSSCLNAEPANALGWLVRGRFLDTREQYDDAIAAYEHILSFSLFDRKSVQNETRLRLAVACVNAGRPTEAIRWAEFALAHEPTSSGKFLLHRAAAMAYGMLGRPDGEERHKVGCMVLAKFKEPKK
jgi:tetratricopeptide (TPR) repeat protein